MINTPEQPTTFSNVKKFFSPSPSHSNSPALPFSYADAAHTQTAPPPKTTSWLAGWSGHAGVGSDIADTWFETMGLTRMQRYAAFAISLAASALLFMLAFINIWLVALRPGKFVVPYCFASLLVAISFGFLHGFVSYVRHLVGSDRRWMSLAFFGTTLMTLYIALSLKNYLLTLLFSAIQGVSMVAYIISYIPGGRSGLSAMATMATGSLAARF